MPPRLPKPVLKPSPLRFALWIGAAVVVAFLAFQHDPGVLGDKLEQAQRDQAARDATPRDPLGRRPDSPAAMRFGVMTRAAHAAALLSLERGDLDNMVVLATKDPEAWVETRVYREARALERALAEGELDAATVPLRSAVALFAELGERAPRLVCGLAIGDERLVGRGAPPQELRGHRVAISEAPTLDLAAALDGADVVLGTAAALQQRLLAGEVDVALAPEPLASSIATRSAAETFAPEQITGGAVVAGAALVIAPAFLRDHPDLAANLVSVLDLATFLAAQDPDATAERACEALENVRITPDPPIIWQAAMRHVRLSTDLPREELARLGGLARTPPIDVAPLIVPELLAAARELRAEALGDR